ncbi:prepilin-type N-terminal cleavage/methylation domain-containing protein [Methylibium petroleiphilum]|uniref:Prepilin-type N-terminal cleavage/methylation domain-containing protein n=1 Tax=Methylibium petroleiphilum (strain ATCC BAA-1232 / LMG 22953 / PM1) TaxID=420662 RepID=A2SMQ4_METPP|nr:prepilin-type N-terminal cleavage/methylation domain-containing protein [Methylibium petroleiphilum]ABM96843.1 hypothetical protein Mpe_B0064 [Methylibium petroleiphilum PM1]
MKRTFRLEQLQRGFTIIELLVVLSIMAMAAIVGAQRLLEKFKESQADLAADDISVVGKAVAAYIPANVATLSLNPTTDITIATLQAGAMLPANYSSGNPWGAGYSIRVKRLGAAPGPYQYEALVITNSRWRIGTVDQIALLGRAVRRIGGPGGLTYDATGAVGNGGAWTALVVDYPNANQAGRLAYFVSQATTPFDSIYLRLDGGNAMTGNLNMNSNGIVAATSVNASGTAMPWQVSAAGGFTGTTATATGVVNAGSVTTTGAMTAGTTVTATGNITSSADVRGATLTSDSDIAMGPGGTVSSSGAINIQPNGALTLSASGGTTVAGSGALTVNDTVTAANDVVISSLPSRAAGFSPSTGSLKALAPKLVEMQNYIITANGQTVPRPTCISGGTPNAFILPHVAQGKVDSARWGTQVRLTGAGPWTVVALDGAGLSIPSVNIPATDFAAIVRTFCTY